MGSTIGEVSHEYKATGCTAVVIVTNEDGSKLTLLPKDKLDSKFDKNGLKINFNYRLLKMPNPPGCDAGIPAELTDISIQ